MARSFIIKAIERRADKTYIRVGKSEVEIPCETKAELREWVRQQLDVDNEEKLLALALAIYFARDPEMTNPASIVGRTFTFDPAGRLNYPDSVVRVS